MREPVRGWTCATSSLGGKVNTPAKRRRSSCPPQTNWKSSAWRLVLVTFFSVIGRTDRGRPLRIPFRAQAGPRYEDRPHRRVAHRARRRADARGDVFWLLTTLALRSDGPFPQPLRPEDKRGRGVDHVRVYGAWPAASRMGLPKLWKRQIRLCGPPPNWTPETNFRTSAMTLLPRRRLDRGPTVAMPAARPPSS